MWTIEDVKARCEIQGDHWIWKLYCDHKGSPRAYLDGRSRGKGASNKGRHRMVRQFVFLNCKEQKGEKYEEPKGAQYIAGCGVPKCVSPKCVRPKTPEERLKSINRDLKPKFDKFSEGWKPSLPKNWKPNYMAASVFIWGQNHG